MAWIKISKAEYESDPSKWRACVTEEDSLKVLDASGASCLELHYAPTPVQGIESPATNVKPAKR